MIVTLTDKYKRDGNWIYTKREKTLFFSENGAQVEDSFIASMNKEKITSKKITVDRYEGVNTDYWEPTAANAIKLLYQLLSLAKMRPDCIWDGD